jgi:hypothetical protein
MQNISWIPHIYCMTRTLFPCVEIRMADNTLPFFCANKIGLADMLIQLNRNLGTMLSLSIASCHC